METCVLGWGVTSAATVPCQEEVQGDALHPERAAGVQDDAVAEGAVGSGLRPESARLRQGVAPAVLCCARSRHGWGVVPFPCAPVSKSLLQA